MLHRHGRWVGCISFILLFFVVLALAHSGTFGKRYCDASSYSCIKVKHGDTWSRLFPNTSERQIVKKVNRLNIDLQSGMILAVPTNLSATDPLSLSPFPERVDPEDSNLIIIDLNEQAFAAYDNSGTLVYWGPVSGGNTWCPDVGRSCRTPTGSYRVYAKGGPSCISSKYPIPFGGAPMPYCMYFHGGYAMHASTLPGYNASHGCVRMLYEDAYWLNSEFVETGKNGTRVIIRG